MESFPLYKYLKWVKWSLLLISALSVILVDKARWDNLLVSAVQENRRDLQMVWDVAARLVKAEGNEVTLPIKGQEAWETMDIYLVEADDTAKFVTPPRFEPMRSLVLKSLEPGYTGRVIDCWTQPVKSARNGESGTKVHKDYRDQDVISAYGIVDMEGRDVVLLVEMDVNEAGGVSRQWFHWLDAILVSVVNLIIATVIFFVHRRLEHTPEYTQQDDYFTHLAKAIRFMPDGGVILTDADRVILEANPEFAKMVGGLGTRDVIGQVADVFFDLDDGFVADIVERPETIKTLDGKEIPVLISLTALNGHFMARVIHAE